eukprot:763496-Hanusia_phi.AAC.3
MNHDKTLKLCFLFSCAEEKFCKQIAGPYAVYDRKEGEFSQRLRLPLIFFKVLADAKMDTRRMRRG